MPQLLTILRRGRDSAAVYSILEGCLLLGGVAVLHPHEALLAAALQASLARLLQALSAPLQPPVPPVGSPQPRSGDGPARLQHSGSCCPARQPVMCLLQRSSAINMGCKPRRQACSSGDAAAGPESNAVSQDLVQEAVAAASLTDVLLKLTGEAGFSFLEPIIR